MLHVRIFKRGPRRGQSIVEFALVLPVLLFLLLMGLDFGRVFLGWVNLNNAARVGANYAALYPTAWNTPQDTTAINEYQRLLRIDFAGSDCDIPGGTPPTFPAPTFPGTPPNEIGQPAVVRITCTFRPITPLIGAIVGNGLSVSASAAFPIRVGALNGMPVQTAVPTPSASPSASASAGPSASASASASPSASASAAPARVQAQARRQCRRRRRQSTARFRISRTTIQEPGADHMGERRFQEAGHLLATRAPELQDENAESQLPRYGPVASATITVGP